MVSLELTAQQCAVLIQLMNSVQGVENVKIVTPIYDAIQAAVKKASEE